MIPAGNTVPAGNDAIALSDPVPALRTDLAAALTVLVENSADARPFKLEDKIIARTRELPWQTTHLMGFVSRTGYCPPTVVGECNIFFDNPNETRGFRWIGRAPMH
jgi:hypothetical protein